MKAIGVIPARFGATRFPGKPLANIMGKPLIEWVIRGVRESKLLTEIMVATDNKEISNIALSLGVKVEMTDPLLPSGSDRCWAAIKQSNNDSEVVVNIQGDEPLIEGSSIDKLIEVFSEKSIQMATLGRQLKVGDLESKNTAKIVLNQNNEALYFSRFPIPFSRIDTQLPTQVCLKHIGLYAYTKSFLKRFCESGPCELERAESLEQLRALYLGAKIKVVQVSQDSWGVDHPEDVQLIEEKLKFRLSK